MGLFSNPEKDKRKAAEARAKSQEEITKRAKGRNDAKIAQSQASHASAFNEALRLQQEEKQKDKEYLASLSPEQLELVLKERSDQQKIKSDLELKKIELKHKQELEIEELERKRKMEDEERKNEKKLSSKIMKGISIGSSLLNNNIQDNSAVQSVDLSDEQKQLLRRGIELKFKTQKKSTFSQTNIEGTLNFTDEFLLFQATEKSATGFGGSSSKSLVVSINDIKSINLESKMFGMSNNLVIKSFNSELNELLSNDNSTVSLGIAKSDVDTAKEIVNKFKMV